MMSTACMSSAGERFSMARRRQQAEMALGACGLECLYVWVIPHVPSRRRKRGAAGTLHASFVGSDKKKVTTVHDYLLRNGWSPLETKHKRVFPARKPTRVIERSYRYL
jgi:hypothetical protein